MMFKIDFHSYLRNWSWCLKNEQTQEQTSDMCILFFWIRNWCYPKLWTFQKIFGVLLFQTGVASLTVNLSGSCSGIYSFSLAEGGLAQRIECIKRHCVCLTKIETGFPQDQHKGLSGLLKQAKPRLLQNLFYLVSRFWCAILKIILYADHLTQPQAHSTTLFRLSVFQFELNGALIKRK